MKGHHHPHEVKIKLLLNFFFFFFLKGNKDSLPQEIEVQQERQKKEKRPLATNLPAQEQQAKKVPPKPKKDLPYTHQLKGLCTTLLNSLFKRTKLTEIDKAQGSQLSIEKCNLLNWL